MKSKKCDFCKAKIQGEPPVKYGCAIYCSQKCFDDTKAKLAKFGIIVKG